MNNQKTQSQVQVQPQNNLMMNAHYQQQQNMQVLNQGSAQLIERRSSGDGVRSNTRSFERRQTNVVFNYNAGQQSQMQPQPRVNNQLPQQIIHQHPPQQQPRSASLSPVPISIPQPQTPPPQIPPQQQQKLPVVTTQHI